MRHAAHGVLQLRHMYFCITPQHSINDLGCGGASGVTPSFRGTAGDLEACLNVCVHLISQVPPEAVPGAIQRLAQALTAKVGSPSPDEQIQ